MCILSSLVARKFALVSSVQSANTYCPQKNLVPNNDAVTRRTSSVRRNFAATSDHSPKRSPLAACCQPRIVASRSLQVIRVCWGVNAPQLFRSCSPSHHTWVTANGSRLPCRVQTITSKMRVCMNAFASNTACASAQVLIEPRSPTTAFQTLGLPSQAPSSQTR